MKILQTIIAFKPSTFGGIKNHLYYQAKEMVKRGHFVEICTTNAYTKTTNNRQRGTKNIEGITVTYFRRALPYSMYFIPMLILYLKKNMRNFDIVHLQDFRTFPNIIAYLFARRCKVPYVLSAGGSVPIAKNAKALKKRVFDKILGKRMLKNAARLIALSNIEKEQYKNANVSEEKITIVPNGVDPSDISESIERGAFKKKYKVENKNVISFMGRIHSIKGLDFLVKSFAELLKHRPLTVLVIAGGDHGYLKELKILIAQLGLQDKIIFTGYLSGIKKWQMYLDSDVFVLPSKAEGFGNVIPEAAYCQTPIVISDGCAISDIVSKNGFGFVARYGDCENLSALILKILKDDKLKENMAQKGKEFVMKTWTWQKSTDILLSVYADILKNKEEVKACG